MSGIVIPEELGIVTILQVEKLREKVTFSALFKMGAVSRFPDFWPLVYKKQFVSEYIITLDLTFSVVL